MEKMNAVSADKKSNGTHEALRMFLAIAALIVTATVANPALNKGEPPRQPVNNRNIASVKTAAKGIKIASIRMRR